MKRERKTIGSIQWNSIVRTILSLLTWQNRISSDRIDSSVVRSLLFQNFYETVNAIGRRSTAIFCVRVRFFFFVYMLQLCTHHLHWLYEWVCDARILAHLQWILWRQRSTYYDSNVMAIMLAGTKVPATTRSVCLTRRLIQFHIFFSSRDK